MSVRELMETLYWLIINNSGLKLEDEDMCPIENLDELVQLWEEDKIVMHFDDGTSVSISIKVES